MNQNLALALEEAAREAGATWPGPLAERLGELIGELLRWNQRVRLVGFEQAEDVLETLVLEALRLLRFVPQDGSLLDLGSGAGFPALVLAAARPRLRVVSVEARAKKVHFQRHAARLLGLANLEIEERRLDRQRPVSAWLACFEAATAQAVATPPAVIESLTPYLGPDGRLILPRGPAWRDERPQALEAASAHGLTLLHESSRTLPLSGASREIVVFERSPAGEG